MDITPVLSAAYQLIGAYGESGFTIAEKRYDGAVIVLPEQTWLLDAQNVDALGEKHIADIASSIPRPEIVLIGTGKQFQPMNLALKNQFRKLGISSDAMDTGAACRTFNVLLSEGRRVAAILFPFS